MRLFSLLAIAVTILVADQLSKWWIWTHFTLNESRPLLGHALSLTYCHNTGGAFSVGQGRTMFFLITGVAVSIALLLYLPKLAKSHWMPATAYALILGGAIGNLIDRYLYHYVVDFIDLGWWPVFNIADSGISVGVFLLFLSLVLGKDESATASPSDGQAEVPPLAE
jgi:signal peptidase II